MVPRAGASAARRLAIAFGALLAVAALAYLVATLMATRDVLREVNQGLHRDLAANLVDRMVVAWRPGSGRAELVELFERLMIANPSIELYLLDAAGGVLAYSARPGQVQQQRVDLEPVQRALASPESGSVLGDDPRHPGRRKLVSVAAIETEGQRHGYLYVVLGGERYDAVVELVRRGDRLRLSLLVLGGGLLLAMAVGLLRYRVLVGRLRDLGERMGTFAASERIVGLGDSSRHRAAPRDAVERLELGFDELAARLGQQMHHLERNDALRRELVAHVSHDLRTPLATLQGYLETLQLMPEPFGRDEQTAYLEAASKHAHRLARLVEELFELAALESPGLEPGCERFALGELVQDVVQKFVPAAVQQGIALRAELMEGLPFVWADIGLIERVLENLIENALRHTPSGGAVTLTLARDRDGVAVAVRDTGSGIASEDLPRIFEPFFQDPRQPRSERRGMGLGLAIVKRILELHGSAIEVESRAGCGSSFRFRLSIDAPLPPSGKVSGA